MEVKLNIGGTEFEKLFQQVLPKELSNGFPKDFPNGFSNGFHQSPFESFMFSALPFFGMTIFILVIGMFIFIAIKGIKQWNDNNAQPVLTVATSIVAKRADVSRRAHGANDGVGHHQRTNTSYFVTFQVESGDRMEFQIKPQEYGLLVEGDVGLLTFQGTRYHSFERKK
ncbi:hypothetical protein JOC73_002821 [Alkaliphilus hydrothermalis]|uniref:DUF2500 domain-containing protein n=1 Tax=Alkaliphilus hydrothermalis TaxID=1482730 RepID=A0ABS2NUH7_9FIRM|nr:hypothetical protein [Alkaliphilus hydrothermalis]